MSLVQDRSATLSDQIRKVNKIQIKKRFKRTDPEADLMLEVQQLLSKNMK